MTELIVLVFVLVFSTALIFALFFYKKKEVDQTQNEAIKDLERRLTDLMIGQLKEIRDSQNGTSKEMNRQIQSFTKETTQIRENLKQIQDKVKDVSSFQEIFKSPKLRGQWGEASL
ncbi:MAG: DNA recombination protein RmuC, partial [Candidatus Pacebacteria bacterium]|nr:DNA recombination protein RmuC [Candidatus Paceibacterota bacterium]